MFTGLIEAVGRVESITTRGNYRILTVACPIANEISVGDSIACDGACLTATSASSRSFVAEVSQESVARTIIEGYRSGTRINLERALKAGERLGGHFVTGHIDDTGTVEHFKQLGESWQLAVKYDAQYDNLVVAKGSIAINGISLTVNQTRPGWLNVNVIPHTMKVTALGELARGDRVNLEFDMIGKYVVKTIEDKSANELTIKKLRESGW